MATTAQKIIRSAFRKCKNKTPNASDVNDAFDTLNDMLSALGGDLLYPALVRETFTLTAGDEEYTIGSGGDFDTVRPIYIKNAYLREGDDDANIRIISLEDYNDIDDKTQEGQPSGLVYLPEYPLGKILLSCAPDSAYELCLDSVKNFTEFTSKTTSVSLPPEYREFLVYNLAIRLAEENDTDIRQSVYALAEESKERILDIKFANQKTPESRFDFQYLILTGKEMGGLGQGDIDSGEWP